MTKSSAIQELRPMLRRQAPEVFMEAMTAGYVSPKDTKATIAELCGSKHIIFRLGQWTVTDTYIVNGVGNQSGGMTILSYADTPVWMMQYLGEYTKDAIPFLKRSLVENYAKKAWFGGRGPAVFRADGWLYTNHPTDAKDFFDFSGVEYVRRPNNTQAGWHKYQGLWMVP